MIKKFLQALRAKSNDVCPSVFTRILNYKLVEPAVEVNVSE
jgi:hypothetical protein